MIENSIDSIFKNYTNTPDVAIGIVSNGEPVINKAFGIANLDFNIAISDSTVFPIALYQSNSLHIVFYYWKLKANFL